MIPWDDSTLRYSGDSPRQARYRLHQSWYREHVLKVAPGLGPGSKPNGAWIPVEEVTARPALNFLEDPELEKIASTRLKASTGAFEPDRLSRSLLSSQPLCVNVFGMLKLHPVAAAALLADVLDLPIATVNDVRIEDAPTLAKAKLGDRTAFDACVDVTFADGRSGFLAIETKYTEQFSKDTFDEERRKFYLGLTQSTPGFTAVPGAGVFERATSQQFRNTLLALLHRDTLDLDVVVPIVLACADDQDADAAVSGLNQWLDPSCQVRRLTLENFTAAARGIPELESWAERFHARYLDVAPSERAQ